MVLFEILPCLEFDKQQSREGARKTQNKGDGKTKSLPKAMVQVVGRMSSCFSCRAPAFRPQRLAGLVWPVEGQSLTPDSNPPAPTRPPWVQGPTCSGEGRCSGGDEEAVRVSDTF